MDLLIKVLLKPYQRIKITLPLLKKITAVWALQRTVNTDIIEIDFSFLLIPDCRLLGIIGKSRSGRKRQKQKGRYKNYN